MLAKLFLKYVLATVFGLGVSDGYATVFGSPGDPLDGEVLACNGQPIPQDVPVCAHRYLPCGTEITVVNLESPAIATCTVADRGPYGVTSTGRWRGVIDLTPEAARRANVTGRDAVRLYYRLPDAGDSMYGRTYWLKARTRPSRMAEAPSDADALVSNTTVPSAL